MAIKDHDFLLIFAPIAEVLLGVFVNVLQHAQGYQRCEGSEYRRRGFGWANYSDLINTFVSLYIDQFCIYHLERAYYDEVEVGHFSELEVEIQGQECKNIVFVGPDEVAWKLVYPFT